MPSGLLELLDPVKEVAQILPAPIAGIPRYQHDGFPTFLLGIVDPNLEPFLAGQPSPSSQLKALVRALRDAELLALGTIPSSCVTTRFAVY